MRKCPYCAEQVQDEAVICKHCKKDIPPQDKSAQVAKSVEDLYNKPLSKRTLFTIIAIIVLLSIYATYRIKHGNTPVPAPQPVVSTTPVTNQPLEYQLAAIQSKDTTPPDELVNQFKDQLYKLSLICPKNTQQQMSDYIVKAHEIITEKRPVFTLLEISNGFYTSVPQTNSSTGKDCTDYLTVYVALVLQGY